MDIDWPPFPTDEEILTGPATEKDLATGKAAFMLRSEDGTLVGNQVKMGLPRLGFLTEEDGEPKLGVVIQVETQGEHVLVGVRHADGSFSVGSAEEFESAPRFLVFYNKPGFGFEQGKKELEENGFGRGWCVAQKANVLACGNDESPVFFCRHATGDIAQQELGPILREHQDAEGLAECDSVFEVSFLDLDEALHELNTLMEIEWTLQDATKGFLYLEWNEHFAAYEEDE